MSKASASPIQDTSSFGPMEETTLDFESLVLGKKKAPSAPTSPPVMPTLQPKTLHPLQPTTNSQPTTPGGFMTPLQPTQSQSPPLPSQPNFFPPLKPSPYTAPSSSSMSSILQPTPSNGLFSPPVTANSTQSSGNPWTSGGNASFPTIAPPPNKSVTTVNPGLAGQNTAGVSGLDKYQSLL